MVRSYEDLIVYQKAYSLALRIFQATSTFPKEEMYSLTDQLRRSSRSIPVNISEGWAKRHFENIFRKHLIDAIGSCDETKVWLQMAQDCGYLSVQTRKDLLKACQEIGRMLHSLHQNWRTFEK